MHSPCAALTCLQVQVEGAGACRATSDCCNTGAGAQGGKGLGIRQITCQMGCGAYTWAICAHLAIEILAPAKNDEGKRATGMRGLRAGSTITPWPLHPLLQVVSDYLTPVSDDSSKYMQAMNRPVVKYTYRMAFVRAVT